MSTDASFQDHILRRCHGEVRGYRPDHRVGGPSCNLRPRGLSWFVRSAGSGHRGEAQGGVRCIRRRNGSGGSACPGRVAKNGSWSFWTTRAGPNFTFAEIQSTSSAELIPLKSNTSYKIAIRVGAESGYGPKLVVVTSTK